MADTTPKSYSADPTLYLYTSLTAGSSHIITATSRLETILKANKIPFKALDVATDEKARMLWGRRSKGKKLPGLVKFGTIVGVRIREANLRCKMLTGGLGPRRNRGVERVWGAETADWWYTCRDSNAQRLCNYDPFKASDRTHISTRSGLEGVERRAAH
jgi:hypothetical protein